LDKREELKLRELIRKELEARHAVEGLDGESGERRATGGMSEERRRMIEEEVAAFHRKRGDTRQYVNDEGDVEWLTEAEIIEREKQLPVDIEELEIGQRKVRNRVVLLSLLLFAGLALMFVSLREETGSVQVICNIPQATIYLNGAPTEYTTDRKLEGLTPGSHIISVAKLGYLVKGERSQRIMISASSPEIVVFRLEPRNEQNIRG
jgi:hypothetical protein